MIALRLSFWLIILVLLPTRNSCANILALFTNTQRSHHFVYMAIVQSLLERQHNVTVISILPLDRKLKDIAGPRLQHIQLEAVKQNLSDDTTTKPSNDVQLIQRMLQRVEDSSQIMQDAALQKFLLNEESTKFDLLLMGYLFNDYQLGIAAHFQCPVALIWTGQPINFIHSLMGNPEERWYVTQPYDRHQYTGWNALAFGAFEKFVELLTLELMRGIYDKYFPQPHYPSLEALRKNISLVLCNHHSISEGPIAPYVPGIIEVGGIQMLAHSQELPKSLLATFEDPTHDIIYFSLGSRVKWSAFPPHATVTFLQVFQQISTNYTILWTYDGNCTELTQNNSRIVCAPWFPQTAILAQRKTRLFITHGGKASVTEALYHGVPMLGLPIFGDQRANVRKIAKQGHGLCGDIFTLKHEELLASIMTLTQNIAYAANVKSFAQRYRDRPLTARESVIYWLEYIIRHKGAEHMRSPLLHLNVLQYYMIDIYAFIFGTFFMFVLICNWLEHKLDRCLKQQKMHAESEFCISNDDILSNKPMDRHCLLNNS